MMQSSGNYTGYVVALLLCLVLSACSGSGSSGDPVEATPPDTTGLAGSDDAPSDDSPGTVPDDSTPLDGDISDAPVGTQGYRRDLSVAECSTQDLNAWVDFDMHDYYIYYDQVPQLNLNEYTDPAALVKDLRIDPDVYSFLADADEQDALLAEGLLYGYGFSSSDDPQGINRFRRIRAGSPMDEAGIKRGDRFLEINGIALSGMSDAVFDDLMFSEGVAPVLTVQTDGAAERSVEVVQAEYRWNTSPYASVFTMPDGQRIGYLLVEAFYQPTEADMDEHIQWLLESGIDDFILDLRYNRGGSVRVSERLASQIAGPALADEPFQTRMRNDKYTELDYTSYIGNESPALSMPRLVVLTTGDTASASETIINGLQPHLDVTVIGAVTRGKPFTSRPIEYCGKNLNAMHSIRVNSEGVSIADGIQPECTVQDQWSYETNDSRDALTSAGLAYLNQTVCETQVAAKQQDSGAVKAASGPAGREPGDDLTDRPMSQED